MKKIKNIGVISSLILILSCTYYGVKYTGIINDNEGMLQLQFYFQIVVRIAFVGFFYSLYNAFKIARAKKLLWPVVVIMLIGGFNLLALIVPLGVFVIFFSFNFLLGFVLAAISIILAVRLINVKPHDGIIVRRAKTYGLALLTVNIIIGLIFFIVNYTPYILFETGINLRDLINLSALLYIFPYLAGLIYFLKFKLPEVSGVSDHGMGGVPM